MWPLGNFYQEAKVKSLTSLTIGIKASPKHWVPLTDWRKFSSIQVASSTDKSIDINCNSAELRSSLVAEIEAWADRELEMRAQILRSASANGGFQTSWSVVSIYYWAVFSACLLMRLLGVPVFRMTSDDLQALKDLFPSGVKFPTEGTFRLEQQGAISATMEGVKLTRIKSNYHQALWVSLFSSLSEIHSATKAGNSNKIEKELVSALLGSLNGNNARLSDVRNLVNYRTDVGFPASLAGVGFSILAEMQSVAELSGLDLLMRMSALSKAVKAGAKTAFDETNVSLLLWSSVTLSVLAQTLYKEVSPVIKFDSSWAKRRYRFGESVVAGVPDSYRVWAPF